MQSFSQGAQRLTITQAEPEFTFVNANGVASTVFTDGRVQEREEDGGGKTKVKSRWKKGKLAISVSFPGGGAGTTPTLTQNYSLNKDGRLLVTTTVGVGGGTRPFTVKRFYDRQEE